MSFVSIAKDFYRLVAGELDPFISEKSEVKVRSYREVSIFVPSHIQFAKYGRGPGKKPPLDSILEYVKTKRFQFRSDKGRFLTYRSTAFIIQNSIGKKGTLNWVPNAPNAIEEAIEIHYKDYQAKLTKNVRKEIEVQLDEIYERTFKKEIKITL